MEWIRQKFHLGTIPGATPHAGMPPIFSLGGDTIPDKIDVDFVSFSLAFTQLQESRLKRSIWLALTGLFSFFTFDSTLCYLNLDNLFFEPSKPADISYPTSFFILGTLFFTFTHRSWQKVKNNKHVLRMAEFSLFDRYRGVYPASFKTLEPEGTRLISGGPAANPSADPPQEIETAFLLFGQKYFTFWKLLEKTTPLALFCFLSAPFCIGTINEFFNNDAPSSWLADPLFWLLTTPFPITTFITSRLITNIINITKSIKPEAQKLRRNYSFSMSTFSDINQEAHQALWNHSS